MPVKSIWEANVQKNISRGRPREYWDAKFITVILKRGKTIPNQGRQTMDKVCTHVIRRGEHSKTESFLDYILAYFNIHGTGQLVVTPWLLEFGQ